MPRAHDSDPQRRRIEDALVAAVAERGHDGVRLEDVLASAGVGQKAFERRFVDLDRCFTEVWESRTGEFLEATGDAYAAAGGWREGLRAAAWAYCRFLQEDHDRARFLIDVAFANPLVQARRDFVMSGYAELVHLGRHERPQAASVRRPVAEAVVGAIWEWVAGSVRSGGFDQLPGEVPQMMYLTVLPYLGVEAAREELERGPLDIERYRRGDL